MSLDRGAVATAAVGIESADFVAGACPSREQEIAIITIADPVARHALPCITTPVCDVGRSDLPALHILFGMANYDLLAFVLVYPWKETDSLNVVCCSSSAINASLSVDSAVRFPRLNCLRLRSDAQCQVVCPDRFVNGICVDALYIVH